MTFNKIKKIAIPILLMMFASTTYSGEAVHQYYLPLFMHPASPSRIEYFTMKTPWNTTKLIRVYIPRAYNDGDKRFPVLYLQDGQAYIGKFTANFIVVGIDSEWWSRWDELSPWENKQMEKWFGISSPRGGKGDEYLSFLLDVKNVVDGKYKTLPDRKHTAVGGASLGGFFAIYAGVKRNDVFSKVIAFSPAVWFGSRLIQSWLSNNYFIDYIKAHSVSDVDFWVYVGGREDHNHECFISQCPTIGDYPTIYVQGAKKTQEILGATLVYNPVGAHNATTFLKYFDEAFAWIDW